MTDGFCENATFPNPDDEVSAEEGCFMNEEGGVLEEIYLSEAYGSTGGDAATADTDGQFDEFIEEVSVFNGVGDGFGVGN